MWQKERRPGGGWTGQKGLGMNGIKEEGMDRLFFMFEGRWDRKTVLCALMMDR